MSVCVAESYGKGFFLHAFLYKICMAESLALVMPVATVSLPRKAHLQHIHFSIASCDTLVGMVFSHIDVTRVG